jgi:hypothetical protein
MLNNSLIADSVLSQTSLAHNLALHYFSTVLSRSQISLKIWYRFTVLYYHSFYIFRPFIRLSKTLIFD